jgi:O-antigen ligase
VAVGESVLMDLFIPLPVVVRGAPHARNSDARRLNVDTEYTAGPFLTIGVAPGSPCAGLRFAGKFPLMAENAPIPACSETRPRRSQRRPAPRHPAAFGAGGQKRPWDVLLVTAAALILIAVGRLHAFFPALSALRPALLVTALAVPALFLSYRGARRLEHLRGPLGYAMAFIVVWAVAGAPFGVYPGNSVRFLLNNFFRTLVVVVVVASAVRNPADLVRLLKVYAGGAIAFSVLGAGEGLRAFGGGGYDPNDASMFIASAIPLVLYFAVRARSLWEKAFFGFGILACGSAVVLSGSRGGFLALAAVMGFGLFALRGVKSWVRVAVVGALVGVIAYSATGDYWDRMRSITDPDDYNRHEMAGRQQVWTRGMEYMAQNPLLGVGIANFPAAEGRHPAIVSMIEQGRGLKWSAAHSIWVEAGAELGVPGLVALVLMFLIAFRLLWATDRRAGGGGIRGDPDLALLGEIGRPLVGVLIGVAVAGSFLSHAYTPLLWMPFALALSVEKLVRMKARQHRRLAAFGYAPGPAPHPRGGRRGQGTPRPHAAP